MEKRVAEMDAGGDRAVSVSTSLSLAICVATMRPNTNSTDTVPVHYPGDIALATANAVTNPRVYIQWNTEAENLGVVGSYDKLYRESTEDVLCFIHDDVIVRERGWDARVLKEFENPRVGVVGFGGALAHGHRDLYKVPYKLQNLERYGYRSNVDDAEVHGERFTGECDVAVLDGFCLCIRRVLLERVCGWNGIQHGCDFYCYDYAISALARRVGAIVRVVGVRCQHRGGGTSVGGQVRRITGQDAYDSSHRWFYESFRDVLPARVEIGTTT